MSKAASRISAIKKYAEESAAAQLEYERRLSAICHSVADVYLDWRMAREFVSGAAERMAGNKARELTPRQIVALRAYFECESLDDAPRMAGMSPSLFKSVMHAAARSWALGGCKDIYADATDGNSADYSI